MSDNNTNALDNIIEPAGPSFTDEEIELLKSDSREEDNQDADKTDDGDITNVEPEIIDDTSTADDPQQGDQSDNIVEPEVDGDKQDKSDTSTSGDDEKSAVEVYYEYLLERGAITPPEDFEFDGSEEALEEAIKITEQQKQQEAIEKFISNLPEDYVDALAYAARTGQPLTDYLENNTTVDFESLDLNDETTQKEVIRSYYKILNPNFTDDKIEKFISRLPEDALEGEAGEAIDYLAQYQQALTEQQRLQEEQEAQKAQQQYVQYQQAINSAIEDSNFVQGRRKNQLKAFVWNEVQREDGMADTDVNRKIMQLASNPEHYVTFLDLLYDYNPENGFNFNKIIEKGKTQATTSFRRSLEERLKDTRGTMKGRKPVDPQVNQQPEN